MMGLDKNPLASVSRFAASACTAKNVPDHHGARVGFGPDFIDMESWKADTFSILNAPHPPARDRGPRVLLQGRVRFGGFPGRGKTVVFSGVGVEVGRLATRKTANMPGSKAGEDTVGRACGFVRVLGFGGLPKHLAGVASRTPESYSRTLPPLQFATAMANLGAASRRACLTMPGLASASPGLFGKVLGQGVGALSVLVLRLSFSTTPLLAVPMLSNSGAP